jgi:hypothetical protein
MSGTLDLHAKYFQFPPPQAVTVCEGKMRTSAQRKTFYAHGLHWLFYGDEAWGTLNYRVSKDGIEWSNPVTLYRVAEAWGIADYFCLFFDGVYVDWVSLDAGRLIYQRGQPNADGTIDWFAPIQQIPDFGPYTGGYKYGASDSFICIDSTGCPWIGTYETNGFDYWTPIVVKNRRNDGIWETDNGFPFYLDTSKHEFCALPVPLTNGKVYALMFKIWPREGFPPNLVYGRLWDGGWGALEQATVSKVNNPDFHTLSVVEDGDDIHLVFPRLDTYELAYVRRTSQGWSPEQVIKQSTSATSPVMCFDERSNELVIFWFENGTLYRAKTINKSWNNVIPEALLTEASNPLTAGDFLCSRRENYLVGITWALPKADPFTPNNILRYCYSGLF